MTVEVVERPSLADVEVHLVDTVAEASEFMRWLGERRPVLAVDTETSGLNPYAKDACGRLIQFGDVRSGWSIPWETWSGVALEAFGRYDGDLVFHNAAFDVRWMQMHLKPWMPQWHKIHDTMIMAQIVNPLGSGALKQLGVQLVDRRANVGETLLKEAMAQQGWTWATVPADYGPFWAYGALDTVITAHLFEILRAHERYPETYQLEMSARRVISHMEENGSPIDLEYCYSMYSRLSEYVEQTKSWGKDTLGISLGSNMQLIKYFSEELGIEVTRTTKSGAPSVDKYQLKMWVNDPPSQKAGDLAKLILDMRKADKLASSYFKNFIEMNVDSVLHPTIKTLGARTGRMSMTNPALQTLPKGEATVRDAFVPHEGNVLISSDYSQIEMRLMAHFSQDQKLIKTFLDADASGDDFFTTIGRDIYSAPEMNKEDPRRALVKGTMYGKAYGAGIPKMAETAGVPHAQMKSVVDAFDAQYPGVRDFQKAVENVGFRRERDEGQGYVMTPFGRRLPCDTGKVYTLVNYMLQGHAAEALKAAIVRLDSAGLGDYMLLPVHDEIIFSVPKEDYQEAMVLIRDVMSITDDYLVPVPADPEGPLDRWGTKYRKKTPPKVEPEMITA